MRIVIQRVSQASVRVGDMIKSSIETGLLVLLGIEDADGKEDIDYLVKKIAGLRLFDDENGVMNRSVIDIDGEILCVSQFTLHASTKKGNRPSYIRASKGEIAEPLYNEFVNILSDATGKQVKTGKFGAMMKVELLNDGPVTIIMDSKQKE
ncbi:MAG: D-tyrosyl-tRNA(Tyr) deacylase [Dysgonamonadaceae bacterium]|nr:D-tyrosyl-tRNA(Tyr) deacylase [Dysgonamonadaceae bacterium]